MTQRARLEQLASFLVPSIADLFFIALFLFVVFLMPSQLLHDDDTAYHIKVGQYVLQHHDIPTQDIFSFIRPALPWVAHEWLAEVIMATVYDRIGFAGIVVLYALILAIAFFLLFRMLMNESGDLLLAAVITVVAILTSGIHWLARPHLFPYY